ncbi:prohead protease/major capsid protein fusion protein [Methylomagnum sp.]
MFDPSRPHTRALEIDFSRADPETRTAPAVISTENPVDHGDFVEILVHTPAAIDLSRAPLPVIEVHDRQKVNIAIVENLQISGGKLRGIVRFGESARAIELFKDVAAGIVRGLSVGYRWITHEFDETTSTVTVTKWQPYETSIVSVPADIEAGFFRSYENPPMENEETTQPQTQVRTPVSRAERKRCVDIREVVKAGGFGDDMTLDLIERGVSINVARSEVLAKLAERSAGGYGPGPRMFDHNDPAERTRGMAEALISRYLPVAPSDFAREFVGLSVIDMAREILSLNGLHTRGMSPARIIERALHTTGDFPHLLGNVANKSLLMAYQAAESGLKKVAKRTSATDFRARSRIRLGEMPGLLLVPEHGEYKHGTMGEQKESYSVATYGRIFGLTRQALVNDDLGGLVDLATAFGRSAANTEAQLLVDLLASNPAMSDGNALFSSAHGNLAGTGGAISVDSLGARRLAMRTQTGIDGTTILNISPRYLVTPAKKETMAEQILTAIQATQASDVNPWPGKLELVPEPRLDADSDTAWYLFADPGMADALEYAYLQDSTGPEIITREGFEIDGLEIKARLDFGAGFIDWRGVQKNPGA